MKFLAAVALMNVSFAQPEGGPGGGKGKGCPPPAEFSTTEVYPGDSSDELVNYCAINASGCCQEDFCASEFASYCADECAVEAVCEGPPDEEGAQKLSIGLAALSAVYMAMY